KVRWILQTLDGLLGLVHDLVTVDRVRVLTNPNKTRDVRAGLTRIVADLIPQVPYVLPALAWDVYGHEAWVLEVEVEHPNPLIVWRTWLFLRPALVKTVAFGLPDGWQRQTQQPDKRSEVLRSHCHLLLRKNPAACVRSGAIGAQLLPAIDYIVKNVKGSSAAT